MNVREIQQLLLALGYDLGPAEADGILGRRTIAAVAAFQADFAVGVKWPGTIGPKTEAALIGAVNACGGKLLPVASPPLVPWMAEAKRRLGLNEVRDNGELRAWLKSDGASVGDPAKIAWCGDFAETCIALTLPGEPLPANPYGARNWAKFGRRLTTPAYGAILVYWRGSRDGWEGHVNFYLGERGGALYGIGGNQRNGVAEDWLDDDRLLDIRWPTTFDLPTTGRVLLTSSGTLSTNEA